MVHLLEVCIDIRIATVDAYIYVTVMTTHALSVWLQYLMASAMEVVAASKRGVGDKFVEFFRHSSCAMHSDN